MPKRIVIATHGHCFDGLCSAVMFTRLMRHIHPNEVFSYRYHSCGYSPGQNGVDPKLLCGDINAILDFRFSTAPQLTWYFDHHVSAFPTDADRSVFAKALETTDRRMFHDGSYSSCTKLIADVGDVMFGLDLEPTRELVRWADMIDSASFPSAEMAVARREPVLQLMSVVEHYGDDLFLAELAIRLMDEPLEKVAMSANVQRLYEPIGRGQDVFVKQVSERARESDGVVVVDLSDINLEVAGKFVTYALYPQSRYSVMLSRSKTKCKISIGYNPWCGRERSHNIAEICERHGGGGHPVVGAIAVPVEDLERAKSLVAVIAQELRG
jgi:hypothetical protein